MLVRKSTWAGALDEFFSDHLCDDFKYGIWDCCLFVCDAIQEMTGTDIAEEFRGRYETRVAALDLIHEKTGRRSIKAVSSYVTSLFDMPQVAPLLLQRGDVALIRRAKDFSLGIVALNGFEIVTTSKDGLVNIPMTLAVTGWRV